MDSVTISNDTKRYGQPQYYRQLAITGSSFFTSPPFKFIVDDTPIYIHASLISQHSKPLERMINGHMAEAQQGFAVLKEVDEDTFIRFVKWAYNGYYSSAEHGPKPHDNHEKSTPRVKSAKKISKTRLFPENWGLSDEDLPLPSTKRQRLKESFMKRTCIARPDYITLPRPRANKDPTEDYTDVFLCHARLYVFAEQYDIQPLKAQAFDELQLTLISYTLYPERTGDIVALMRYIYANTGEPVAGVEDLRTLLTAYMSYEMDVLMKDKAFKELMFEDGGALLGDFMGVVEKRI